MMSGFKSGGEHHLAKGVAQAKEQVLEKVRVGVSPQAAMIAIGKKPDTIRQWMVRDPLFAAALEEAKEEGSKQSFDALGVEKESIPFAEFSKMFFDQTVFPHHQNWIDLLEGREP
jgi:ATP-dependent DNA ligase